MSTTSIFCKQFPRSVGAISVGPTPCVWLAVALLLSPFAGASAGGLPYDGYATVYDLTGTPKCGYDPDMLTAIAAHALDGKELWVALNEGDAAKWQFMNGANCGRVIDVSLKLDEKGQSTCANTNGTCPYTAGSFRAMVVDQCIAGGPWCLSNREGHSYQHIDLEQGAAAQFTPTHSSTSSQNPLVTWGFALNTSGQPVVLNATYLQKRSSNYCPVQVWTGGTLPNTITAVNHSNNDQKVTMTRKPDGSAIYFCPGGECKHGNSLTITVEGKGIPIIACGG